MSHSLSQAVRRFPQLLAAPAVAGLLVLLPMSSARAQQQSVIDAAKDFGFSILPGIIDVAGDFSFGFIGGACAVCLDIADRINKCRRKKTNRKFLNDINSQVNTISVKLAENGRIYNAIHRIDDIGSKVNIISVKLAENDKIKGTIGRIEEKVDELNKKI